jgi:hypothetical protein
MAHGEQKEGHTDRRRADSISGGVPSFAVAQEQSEQEVVVRVPLGNHQTARDTRIQGRGERGQREREQARKPGAHLLNGMSARMTPPCRITSRLALKLASNICANEGEHEPQRLKPTAST